jgi:hypothetical protein
MKIQQLAEGFNINPLKAELNPICHLLALLVHHFLHISRVRVKQKHTKHTAIYKMIKMET